MGNYNPSAAYGILGQEWVGIRDEAIQFSPLNNTRELGHSFVTASANVLQDGRFYVSSIPPNTERSVYSMAIYPYGGEALSGPVRRLIMPVQSAFVTGGVSIGAPATTATQALQTPSFGKGYVLLDSSVAQSWVSLGFNTAPYTILNGKRIVSVALLYAAFADYGDSEGDIAGPFFVLGESPIPISFSNFVQYSDGSEVPLGDTTYADPFRVDMGEVSHFWNPGVGALNPEALPWNFADLQRFDPDIGGTKLYLDIVTGSNYSALPGSVFLWYAALEVLYCEETRIAVGGSYRGITALPIRYGANPVTMRDITTRAANPTLAAGTWTVTASIPGRGSLYTDVGFPDLYGLRELYQIPSHQGRELSLTQTVGDEFSVAPTHILPQLSLHASGGTLTEPHAYGAMYPAPVYGSVQAIQEIRDDTAGGSASYPQIRFWARHWTGTTAALVVSGLGTAAGSVASITVDEFDALPIIRDGWREVDLRFAVAPTMGSLTPDPQYAWISTAEVAGSRWEVLAVQAPAVSGVTGDYLPLVVPASQRLDVATYQPPVGATVELTTLSVYASGGVATQSDVDAAVLFSTDPAAVAGLSVSLASQTLTPLAGDCGADCCVPTALSYHRLTWTASAVSSSGFGAYELQRFDATDGAWRTIMSASSPATTGFNDYEARVGVATAYRIRQLNLYRFAGAWSAAVTGTITAPGVTVACDTGGTGLLAFTSNSDQTGSTNVAYLTMFAGKSIDEPFTFPEAGRTQLRWQYGRDYQVASRPSERGGMAFTRVLMTQNAAGALPSVPDMDALSDVAWADVPYICVRDEKGNRWLANVNVPDGVLGQRAVWNVNAVITEITRTPTEVDPS